MSTDTETGHPPMRRKDRAITDPAAIEKILRRADVCRVGMIADGEPYVVPLNFGYRDGKVYFHSFSSGRKIDAI
ncbi:MAG TPA: pyridoxamine 5'-phosphate oxidase family protein, partial [Chloroflexota bacterium]|nr:pyridoxamine 5'-phosphate oxidase family protein [Chloroflexota bacterium]